MGTVRQQESPSSWLLRPMGDRRKCIFYAASMCGPVPWKISRQEGANLPAHHLLRRATHSAFPDPLSARRNSQENGITQGQRVQDYFTYIANEPKSAAQIHRRIYHLVTKDD